MGMDWAMSSNWAESIMKVIPELTVTFKVTVNF